MKMKMRSKRGMLALLAAAVAVLMIMPAVSDSSEGAAGDVFLKTNFGGSGNDTFMSMISVSGGYIAIGFSDKFDGDWAGRGLTGKGLSDGTIVKFNTDGTVAWAKNFGGSGYDTFYSVVEVSDGYVVVGISDRFDKDWSKFKVSGKGSDDAIVVKFNFDGTVAWAKNFGGSGEDRFGSVTAVSDGFVVCGKSNKFDKDWAKFGATGKGGDGDAVIVKFNNEGTVVWAKNFGGSGNDNFASVQSVSGGIIAAGSATIFDKDWAAFGLIGKGGDDAAAVKFNDDGSVGWANKIGGIGSDQFYPRVVEVPGGYIASGYASVNGGDWTDHGLTSSGSTDYIFVKFKTDGSIEWANNFGGSKFEAIHCVTAVSDGIVVAGYSENMDVDWAAFGLTQKGTYDATIVKINYDGTVAWAKNFGGSGGGGFYGMVAIPGGLVVVGWGNEASFGTGDWTGFTAKGGQDATFVIFDDGTFAPVTGITGVPTSLKVGDDVLLKGTVVPSGASNKTITWSVKSPGTTGATISGSVLSTTSTGTVVITATIAGGVSPTTPYVQDFEIEIKETAPKSDSGLPILWIGLIAIIAIAAVGAALVFRSRSKSK